MGYIYCITNNVNGKKYVGKTTSSIEKRFKKHLYDCDRRFNEKRPLYFAMRLYGKENFFVEKIEECENNILDEREKYWVLKLHTYENGYNATLGGDGKILIDENEVIKLYEKNKNATIVAKKLDRDYSQILRILKRNNIAVISHPYDSGVIKHPKKIYQYALDGKFIQSFESINNAMEFLFENKIVKNKKSGIRGHICDNANGKIKTAYGFIWKYEKPRYKQHW